MKAAVDKIFWSNKEKKAYSGQALKVCLKEFLNYEIIAIKNKRCYIEGPDARWTDLYSIICV